MEDIIAFILIALVIAVPIWTGVVLYRRQKRKHEQSMEKYRTAVKDDEMLKDEYRAIKLNRATPTKVKAATSYTAPKRSEPTPASSSSSSSGDFLDGMITGYVVNSLIDSITHSASSSSNSSNSSWGLDDSDSRKSASDTFSSSDSSSSWSSSDSSDSGPSSDW